MMHSAEKRSRRASCHVCLPSVVRNQKELPHTFSPILRTWLRCGVNARISEEAHRREFDWLCRFSVSGFWTVWTLAHRLAT